MAVVYCTVSGVSCTDTKVRSAAETGLSMAAAAVAATADLDSTALLYITLCPYKK